MQPLRPKTTTRDDLRIRPADAADRPALEQIAAQVWEGRDYLPRVFDAWLSDPHGGFFVATLRDRVVGAIKLTRLGPEEWWLEGLRVAPSQRGRGLSRILHHFAINRLRQSGGRGEVRFSTASENHPVRKLATETGFQRVASFVPLGADVLAGPVEGLRALGPADAARVQAWLAGSGQARRNLEDGWTFYRLTPGRLAERLEAGLVYGWPSGSGDALGGVVILNPADPARAVDDPVLRVAYLDAPAEVLTAVAHDLRRLAVVLKRARVRVKAHQQADRLAALIEGGFEREWDGEVWLYARDVSLTLHADVRTEQLPPLN